jgi:microcystin-dependent protein
MATTSFTITNFTANGNEQTLTNQAGEVQVVTNYFPYLRDADVKVSVKAAGASSYTQKDIVSHWTINDSKHIVFKENVLTGSVVYSVLVRRNTDITSSRVSFQTGSSVNAGDLNTNSTQLRYSIEELDPNTTVSTSEIAIADDAVTTAKILDDNVTYAKLQDIGTANRVLGKASTGTVEEVQIVEAMMANNSVNTNQIVNNAVTSDKVTPGGFNPVGTVIWYAGTTAPAGYLKCNGDTLPNDSTTSVQGITADWTTLYAIVGANLPDLRGEFIRGWDDSKGTDSGRGIRTSQSDQNKQHNHTATSTSSVTDPGHIHQVQYSNSDSGDGVIEESGTGLSGQEPTLSATTGITVATATTVANTGGTEARPRNIALLACIKY